MSQRCNPISMFILMPRKIWKVIWKWNRDYQTRYFFLCEIWKMKVILFWAIVLPIQQMMCENGCQTIEDHLGHNKHIQLKWIFKSSLVIDSVIHWKHFNIFKQQCISNAVSYCIVEGFYIKTPSKKKTQISCLFP